MQITKLSAQVKRTGRVNVFVDGKYELSLSIDQVLQQQLKVGYELDGPALKQLHKLSEDGKLQARALEWCLIRPRSQKELRDYLHKKGASPELIESICKKFANKNYQNDEKFTEWWVDNRARKNKSNLSITTELRQKGVSQQLIAKYLQLQAAPKSRLKQLIVNKRLLSKYPESNKLKQYLAGKGFIYSDIAEVLAELAEPNDGADSF